MSTIDSYLLISANIDKWRSIAAKTPEATVQTNYFQANIGKVKSAEELIDNPRLFNYAMSAFGLSDMTYAKGLIKKVLDEGVSNSQSMAHTLQNNRILALAKAFDFAGNGANTTAAPGLVSDVVSRYAQVALETDQGQQNPGVQLALYFQRVAPSVTSLYGILADKDLLTVVQTALSISPMTSAQPIDTQYNVLSKQLNPADFQDPAKLQRFLTRFSAMYDANNSSSGNASPASAALAILSGDASS
jgi:hypothetical protein